MINLARSSLALVLAALAGAANSCALANIFMICPRWSASGEPTRTNLMSLITAISWLVVYPDLLHIDNDARATQLREAHDATWAPARVGGIALRRGQHCAALR